jgi:thiamine kinase-like enzyme
VTAVPAAIERSIRAALRSYGVVVSRLIVVSPLAGQMVGRIAVRVDASDGTTLKARHVVDASTARALCRLRDGLDPGFAPVIEQIGPVLLEEWIDGTSLSSHAAAERSAEAGALLGRLHATALHAVEPARRDTAPWHAKAISDLAILMRANRLSHAEVAAIRSELCRRDPGSARAGLIHRDLCPENLIVDRADRLIAIDNEWMMVGVPEFDLGRTLGRWPMADATWDRFLSAHTSAWAPPEALGFWCIVATLMGARVLQERVPERLDPMLTLLRRVAGLPQ